MGGHKRPADVFMEQLYEEGCHLPLTALHSVGVTQGRKRRRDFKPMPDQIETRNGKQSEALDKHHNDEVLHMP